MMNKMLITGFFTAIMLITSLVAIAAPNNSLTEHELGTQPINENSNLDNVTITGRIRILTKVEGPFGIKIPKIVPASDSVVYVLNKEGSMVTWALADNQGYYECSVEPMTFYELGVKIIYEDDWICSLHRPVFVLSEDKHVSFILWYFWNT